MAFISIGIDLGGTHIKAVVLDADGKSLHQSSSATNDNGNEDWKNNLNIAVEEIKKKLGQGNEIVIGLSAPGITNKEKTAILYMPGRLQGLENLNWSEYFHCPSWVMNDAVAALHAEIKSGAALGQKNVVLLTLGTGVGGAIVIDGKPYAGNFQKAGHLGHITLNTMGECDITGIPGSLEDAIGNCTIGKRSMGKYQSTHDLIKDYRNGNYFAQWVWLTSVRNLAAGIASITNILSPELVLLGGGITLAGADLFEPLESFLALYEWRPAGNRAEIKQAHFADFAGATGAALFALEQQKL